MSKIVFIGGGSSRFVKEMAVDLFSYEALQDVEITLVDIDAERVERSERLVRHIIQERGLAATVDSTLNQREALDGADFIIITIMVGGLKHYASDTAIPSRYGVWPTVGDTTGPGGVFRAVRTTPVLRKIVEDVQQVAPGAWILNYANPMSMNMWAIRDSGYDRAVGLCHSIQNCYREVARWLGLPPDEVSYTAGGINHINFYLTLEHDGRSLYPELLANRERLIRQNPALRVWLDQVEYLGHLTAEGPNHQLEYYPWFRRTEAQVEEYGVETGWGYRVDSANVAQRAVEAEEQIAGRTPIEYRRSQEYGARIIHSLTTGQVRTFYGNVPNHGLIENLPAQAIVETPCLVDHNGIFPCHVGRIPPQLAAVMTPHIALHEMAVAGTFRKDRDLIRQAIQADPLTSAVCTLAQIKTMVNELFEENREYVADWPQ